MPSGCPGQTDRSCVRARAGGLVLLFWLLGVAMPGAESTSTVLPVSFKLLAGWTLPDGIYKAKPGHVLQYIPQSVRKLDSMEICITGFMLPTAVQNRQVTAFMLLRNQNTCCFGIPPELFDVVEVFTAKKPVGVLMDTPVTVTGHFHVRERWQGTYLCTIYQMEAEKVQAE